MLSPIALRLQVSKKQLFKTVSFVLLAVLLAH